MKLRIGRISQALGTMSTKTMLQILVLTFLLIIALAGGDPKPQENVRVVPVPHSGNPTYRNRQKDYTNSLRRDHQKFRNKYKNRNRKQKSNVEEDKFKLWKEGPNFDTDLRQNVYAQEGQTGVMTCRVYDRGNKTVSWIRHHDLHILTVGRYTYTADMRFHSKYNAKKDEWRLEVQSVQKHDSGRYECQVNTQPVRSFFVQLNVVDALPLGKGSRMILNDGSQSSSANKGSSKDSDKDLSLSRKAATKAIILGDKDVYIDVGSSLNLACNVKQIDCVYPCDPYDPQFIIWMKNNKTIDYDANDGSEDNRYTVTLTTNDSKEITSRLKIHSVLPSDAGKYICHPSDPSRDASVKVHVIDGEQKAAIRTNSASRVHFGDFSTHIAQSVTIHARIINAVFHSTVIAQIGAQYLVLLALVLLPSVLYTKQFDTVSLQRP